MQQMSEELIFVGVGKIEATLYDLGNYPGAIKSEAAHQITGDVFEVKSSEKVFALLDDYEGDEYRREKVIVTLATGCETDAWIYWYIGNVKEEQRIKNNDYLEYLKNKKDRFV